MKSATIPYPETIFTKQKCRLIAGRAGLTPGVRYFAERNSNKMFREIDPETISLFSLMKNFLPLPSEQNLSWVREEGLWFLGGGIPRGMGQRLTGLCRIGGLTTTNPILELPGTSGIDIHNHFGYEYLFSGTDILGIARKEKPVTFYILSQMGIAKFSQPFDLKKPIKLKYAFPLYDRMETDTSYLTYRSLYYFCCSHLSTYFAYYPPSDYSALFKQIGRNFRGESIQRIFSQNKEVMQFLSWGWIMELVKIWGLDIHKHNSMRIFLNTKEDWVATVWRKKKN